MQLFQVLTFTLILGSFVLISSAVDQRIINGIDVEKPIPYQVGLRSNTGLSIGSVGCGGTLISKRAVLTAAHCVENAIGVELSFASLMNANLYDSNRRNIYLPKKYIFVHEDYDRTYILNDIAIIRLPVEILFSELIKPANLPKGDWTEDDFANRTAIASGWGITTTDINEKKRKSSDVLQQVTLDVISNEICKKSLTNLLVPPSYICTDSSQAKSICFGDSGGPLVVHDDSNATVIGISSFVTSKACIEGPAVFTRVSEFLPWIEALMY